MTVTTQDDLIRLEGIARVEDAETLTAALQTSRVRLVDLSACNGLHAAVLQVLLLYRPAITGVGPNPALAEWLPPLLEAGRRETEC